MCIGTFIDNLRAWKNIGAPDYVKQWINGVVTIAFKAGTNGNVGFDLLNRNFKSKECFFIEFELSRLID